LSLFLNVVSDFVAKFVTNGIIKFLYSYILEN